MLIILRRQTYGDRKMKKNKMEQCWKCKNLDKEKSNKNWIVCPKIPISIMLSGASKTCEEYKTNGGKR